MGHHCCAAKTETISSTIQVEAKIDAVSPKAGEKVIVHYVGRLLNEDGTLGQEFDSSRKRGKPFEFVVGKGYVIRGWDIALSQMKVGETRRVTIPPSLGYGERGVPGAIPKNATLVFDIELLNISEK